MTDCGFCAIVAKKERAHIVYEDNLCLAFLDKYPQSRGHLQLIPKKHYRWIWEAPDMGEIFSIARRIIRAIIPVLGADHVTITTFGRQITHAHIWIVPQYAREVGVRESDRSESDESDPKFLAASMRDAIIKEV